MNDQPFPTLSRYIFKRAIELVGKCNLILYPGSLIAVGKLYPRIERIANDNEAKP